MSNKLDPDQARHFVGPDLGPNCFQNLPADDTCRQSIKHEAELSSWARGLYLVLVRKDNIEFPNRK